VQELVEVFVRCPNAQRWGAVKRLGHTVES
jgi:hypothetical protein